MYKFFLICNNKNIQKNQTKQGGNQMKATGVVRRIDDLGRVCLLYTSDAADDLTTV